MNGSKLFTTAGRVLRQLRHDRRTLALLFVVPPALLILLKYVFQGAPAVFGSIAPLLLGIFPMIMMFLVTSIATLRERTSGTLDRLLTMPISKLDFIIGYAVAFSCLALAQAVISAGVLLGPLHVHVAGGLWPALAAAVIAAFLGTSLGLFVSAFASGEFQAVQFLPAFIFPQLLTCGLFVARAHMARPLQWLADVLPLTYSVDAMRQLTSHGGWPAALVRDLVVVMAYALAALLVGSLTIRRQD